MTALDWMGVVDVLIVVICAIALACGVIP